MKYLDTYRDPVAARELIERIGREVTRPWTVVEVCGGQALNLVRFDTDRNLPASLELIHGPSCPISVLSDEPILRALTFAGDPTTIVCTRGDLLNVPVGRDSLHAARARGADVRVVYSPLDALALARKHPDRHVVSLAVGFETTAPAAAAAVLEADRLGLSNLSLICGFFRLETAVAALLKMPGNRARAALTAGPVCAVTGIGGYETLARTLKVPVIVTGPEPHDLLEAILRACKQLERGAFEVDNQYSRAVRPDGNPQARLAIETVFESAPADWRGLGTIPESGLVLRARFRAFDASGCFSATGIATTSPECRERDVLTGRLKPMDCPAFGSRCRPDHPLGAAMVSPEGTCAAYYRYRRSAENAPSPSALTVLSAPVVP